MGIITWSLIVAEKTQTRHEEQIKNITAKMRCPILSNRAGRGPFLNPGGSLLALKEPAPPYRDASAPAPIHPGAAPERAEYVPEERHARQLLS